MKYLVLGLALVLPMIGAAAAQDDPVKRGEYLVTAMGCNDCHTPFMMGPNGPEPDMSKMLSGHPQEIVITEQAVLSGMSDALEGLAAVIDKRAPRFQGR